MTRKIRNTAQEYGPGHPAFVLREDFGSQIEAMETEGQQQLVHSDRMPTRLDREAFEAVGFTFGDPDPGDPLFMPATMPPGWKREGSGHAMWSYIRDEHGRRRVGIFYKAAYYDRDAFAHLNSLETYVREVVSEGGQFVFDDTWATPATVTAALTSLRDDAVAKVAEFREYHMDDSADRRERDAEAFAAALKALEAGNG